MGTQNYCGTASSRSRPPWPAPPAAGSYTSRPPHPGRTSSRPPGTGSPSWPHPDQQHQPPSLRTQHSPRQWKTTPTGSDIPAVVIPTCRNPRIRPAMAPTTPTPSPDETSGLGGKVCHDQIKNRSHQNIYSHRNVPTTTTAANCPNNSYWEREHPPSFLEIYPRH